MRQFYYLIPICSALSILFGVEVVVLFAVRRVLHRPRRARDDERGEPHRAGVPGRPHLAQHPLQVRLLVQPGGARHAAHAHRRVQAAADILRPQGDALLLRNTNLIWFSL